MASGATSRTPSILLCDEPTGALDTTTGEEILDLLAELNREGTTLLVVTHDPGVARRQDRAIRILDGRIGADGTPDEVLGPRTSNLPGEIG